MIDGIKCPACGSEKIAAVLYGMPRFTEELERKLEAGEVVLNGCEVVFNESMYPYECQECGHRFDAEMAEQLSAKAFFSVDDYAWIENLAAYWGRDEEECNYIPFTNDEDLALACADLADILLSDNPDGFSGKLDSDYPATYHRYDDETFARLVILGLEYGVACGDGGCANWLGALYYMGDIVDQDYNKAKELFELAESKGIEQAMLNLGYIYEYGRTGAPDHQKAFNQYAKVAALTNSPEALYKLGDMYSRAKIVDKDLRTAFRLYVKSYLAADGDVVAQAQPAIRLANLVSDRANRVWDIPYDPMRALEFYQLAERGLRIDIAHGQAYYEDRLQEALEGQERMRAVLDDPSFFVTPFSQRRESKR